MNGVPYFSLEARNFDYDGKQFGEVTVKLAIEKFRGVKRINLLDAYPLQYHNKSADMRTSLIQYGRTFVSLIGSQHHREYQGKAFWRDEEGGVHHVPVNSRIMVDASTFQLMNPNYARPQVDKASGWYFWPSESDTAKGIQYSGVATHEMEDDELLICSPTVTGFSFDDKQWRR